MATTMRDYDCHLGDDPETVGVFGAANPLAAAHAFVTQLDGEGWGLVEGGRVVVSMSAGGSDLWVYEVTDGSLALVQE